MVTDDTRHGSRRSFGPALGGIERMQSLTDRQREAALEHERDVLVTAGAGSGKTLTLVARYLALLERSVNPRRILAITFTEKAALEMRARVRLAVTEAADQAPDASTRDGWLDLESSMDAARIGTIHSLCAEVLRHHPAEAELDPTFEVVDEGMSAQLKVQAAEDALLWLAGTTGPEKGLFESFTPQALHDLLVVLLGRRLDADEVLRADRSAKWSALLAETVVGFVAHPDVSDAVDALREMSGHGALVDDAGEKLAAQIEGLLAGWELVEAAVHENRGLDASVALYNARRPGMGLGCGKKSSIAKGQLRALQHLYDELAAPWLGGKSGKEPPDPSAEDRFEACEPWLITLYGRCADIYRDALTHRRAVDFDTLEGLAVALLKRDDVGQRWRGAFDAVLVDEFQDTNRRQVDIVRALTSDAIGKLFVVGDARQSIYRFRGADVTAFRALEDRLRDGDALWRNLDTSFRAHAALLSTIDALLPPLMGAEDDHRESYWVPYTRLLAHEQEPRSGVRPPYVEVVLGMGTHAEGARYGSAHALAARLHQLHSDGEIRSWEDVGLLFRASGSFQAYEDAFEHAGIPFVTVAGRGFYDRPEVRDILGMLRALAQPWDDASMAGLLRSPAFGLTDAGLYKLRCQGESIRPFRAALAEDLSVLDDDDRAQAERAHQILTELEPVVDRLSVAALLKRLVDAVDYRAVLATAPQQRPWRNLDKLLADAHTSRKVRVREFLDYLTTLKDVGAREGEAAAEASGAVQLMTVHKAKGLQFPFVVLADASHQGGGSSAACYLEPSYGAATKLDKLEAQPMAFRVAKWRDGLRSQAESMRILYVAMTRAEQKLLISGGATERADEPATTGWLAEILDGAGVSLADVTSSSEGRLDVALSTGAELRISTASPQGAGEPHHKSRSDPKDTWPGSNARALWNPVAQHPGPPLDDEQHAAATEDLRDDEPERSWRATGARAAPAKVVGRLVHRAVENWCFPCDDGYETIMRAEAYRERLVDADQRRRALARVAELLLRLRNHALWAEIEGSDERHHEVPFTSRPRGQWEESGFIDVLFRTAGTWHVVDIKTDELDGTQAPEHAASSHRSQMDRYARAVRELLGAEATVRLCFLDWAGEVQLVQVRSVPERP